MTNGHDDVVGTESFEKLGVRNSKMPDHSESDDEIDKSSDFYETPLTEPERCSWSEIKDISHINLCNDEEENVQHLFYEKTPQKQYDERLSINKTAHQNNNRKVSRYNKSVVDSFVLKVKTFFEKQKLVVENLSVWKSSSKGGNNCINGQVQKGGFDPVSRVVAIQACQPFGVAGTKIHSTVEPTSEEFDNVVDKNRQSSTHKERGTSIFDCEMSGNEGDKVEIPGVSSMTVLELNSEECHAKDTSINMKIACGDQKNTERPWMLRRRRQILDDMHCKEKVAYVSCHTPFHTKFERKKATGNKNAKDSESSNLNYGVKANDGDDKTQERSNGVIEHDTSDRNFESIGMNSYWRTQHQNAIKGDIKNLAAEEKENETYQGSQPDGKDEETTEEDVMKCDKDDLATEEKENKTCHKSQTDGKDKKTEEEDVLKYVPAAEENENETYHGSQTDGKDNETTKDGLKCDINDLAAEEMENEVCHGYQIDEKDEETTGKDVLKCDIDDLDAEEKENENFHGSYIDGIDKETTEDVLKCDADDLGAEENENSRCHGSLTDGKDMETTEEMAQKYDMDDHDAEEKENETCYGSNIDGKDNETTEEDLLKCDTDDLAAEEKENDTCYRFQNDGKDKETKEKVLKCNIDVPAAEENENDTYHGSKTDGKDNEATEEDGLKCDIYDLAAEEMENKACHEYQIDGKDKKTTEEDVLKCNKDDLAAEENENETYDEYQIDRKDKEITEEDVLKCNIDVHAAEENEHETYHGSLTDGKNNVTSGIDGFKCDIKDLAAEEMENEVCHGYQIDEKDEETTEKDVLKCNIDDLDAEDKENETCHGSYIDGIDNETTEDVLKCDADDLAAEENENSTCHGSLTDGKNMETTEEVALKCDIDDLDAEEKKNENCYGSNIDGKDKETTEEDVLKCDTNDLAAKSCYEFQNDGKDKETIEDVFKCNKDDHAAEENENETCHEIVEKDEETTEENVLKRAADDLAAEEKENETCHRSYTDRKDKKTEEKVSLKCNRTIHSAEVLSRTKDSFDRFQDGDRRKKVNDVDPRDRETELSDQETSKYDINKVAVVENRNDTCNASQIDREDRETKDKDGLKYRRNEGASTGISVRFCHVLSMKSVWILLLFMFQLSSGIPVGVDIVWIQSTIPAVFGEYLTLTCYVHTNTTKHLTWHREPSMELLALKDKSSNNSKFLFSLGVEDQYCIYNLTILNLDPSDLNRWYRCSNFDKYHQQDLNFAADKFIYKPSIEDVEKRTQMVDGTIKAEWIISQVYPEPTCLLFAQGEQIDKSVSRLNTSNDLFAFLYTFEIQCTEKVSMTCDIHGIVVFEDYFSTNATLGYCNNAVKRELITTLVTVSVVLVIIIIIIIFKMNMKRMLVFIIQSHQKGKEKMPKHGTDTVDDLSSRHLMST